MSPSRLILLALAMLPLGLGLICAPGATDGGNGGGDMTAPESVGGTLDVGSFTVPLGQTTRVTSDLVINAGGNVNIAGLLLADPPSTPGSKGPGITIVSQGSISVAGVIQAASGNSGENLASSSFTITQAGEQTDPAGGDGGAVELNAAGDLTVAATAAIICGSGGQGASGQWGGAGGSGGDLRLSAGETLGIHGSLTIGDGGNGGDASPGGLPLSDLTVGAAGGSSGAIFVKAGTFDWPGYNPQESTLDMSQGLMFQGGLGGSATPMVILLDLPTVSAADASQHYAGIAQAGSVCGSDECTVTARNGGDGFFMGGHGGSVTTAFTQLQAGTYDGPVIRARGGNGGNLISRVDPQYGQAVTAIFAHAGDGGIVSVLAPAGRDGDTAHYDGGYGGTAIAYGGNGGSGAMDRLQYGGAGGQAVARAGDGGMGNSGCAAVGNGGAGGIANAYGGTGGSAGFAGEGGDAAAIGGNGGAGGDGGHPAGSGGASGKAVATCGNPGQYNAGFYSGGAPIFGCIDKQSPGQVGYDGVDYIYSRGPDGGGCPEDNP
jgi:hypothetical protein